MTTNVDWRNLDPNEACKLPREQFRQLAAAVLTAVERDSKESGLLYYKPVSDKALRIHTSTATTVGVGGGNGSSKTETCLVEMVMLCCGVTPRSLEGKFDPDKKFKGPVRCRVVCESLTNVLHQIILPKLQWWNWTGIDQPGGKRGHWGWVPRNCLIDGSWDKSWSEKLRTLRILHRDPHNNDAVLGESIIQFMSHDNDPTDFASGDFDMILHDECPSYAIWTENEARTMRVGGRNFLAMTWPDDPAIAVDWLMDDVYQKGQPGPTKSPDIDWFNLFTTENMTLGQEFIQKQHDKWSDEIAQVRIYGQPIRFSNRIHPLFTDATQWWCFDCKKTASVANEQCSCGSRLVVPFCHVAEFDSEPNWPTVYVLDPHPRKPHMMQWVQISPSDDYYQIAEAWVDGDPTDVKLECDRLEELHSIKVGMRLMDPNMGASPSGAKRGISWQQEFDAAGLACDLADDSGVGRKRIDTLLQPDPNTGTPRITVHRRCENTIYQFNRYTWSDHKRSLEKDQKQKPQEKNDDHPALWRYLANREPTFRGVFLGDRIISTRPVNGRRKRPGHTHRVPGARGR